MKCIDLADELYKVVKSPLPPSQKYNQTIPKYTILHKKYFDFGTFKYILMLILLYFYKCMTFTAAFPHFAIGIFTSEQNQSTASLLHGCLSDIFNSWMDSLCAKLS